MSALAGKSMIPSMDRPLTSSKLLLVPDSRTVSGPGRGIAEPAIRRYRIARLHLEGRTAPPASRYEYLKRVFD
jgi:hypothetical protein